MKNILIVFLLFFNLSLLQAQHKTETIVEIDLNGIQEHALNVKVSAPKDQKTLEFVIPDIVPGTYMTLKYVDYFKKVRALDINGQEAEVKRKKNVFYISAQAPIDFLAYTVVDATSKRGIVGKPSVVEGTVFTPQSALINFNMLNGYFEGFEKTPFKVVVKKPSGFYGATSMKKLEESDQKDVLYAENYFGLIDQPVLYAVPDTASFVVGGQKCIVAVHNEKKTETAPKIKEVIEDVMHQVNNFSGVTSQEDYYFLIYEIDEARLKGMFKYMGTGSALEHRQSSVYYNTVLTERQYSYMYDHVSCHEYFHTITPLELHSEKIKQFNYRTPDMSRHTWFYEGFTDYFAMRTLNQSYTDEIALANSMSYGIATSQKRHKQSMIESSQDIIRKKNVFSFISKLKDLMAFYEKGAMIAFCLDLKIMERSNGEKRLIDVVLEIQKDYKGRYFRDEDFVNVLRDYTYAGFGDFYKQYIEGTATPNMQNYCDKLGWKYYPEGEKIPRYGNFYVKKDHENDKYTVTYTKGKNTLGLKKGDQILAINGVKAKEFYKDPKNEYYKMSFPKLGDSMVIQVQRKGEKIMLDGEAVLTKLKYARMKVLENPTEDQMKYKSYFFKHLKNVVEM
ncbi:M61 family metallopeptidase [Flammeovirga aprica]|uniref:Peptidase M61 n=1 Tax=Flammeovirga aprica JL-4 TaxID=694437 RepID=A0A7X9NZH5_9BACT|nr:hypothetical protein [Flammeovirga aprica]NME66530.1 hypothetical protein [Flammeovirga aprica JL-4]